MNELKTVSHVAPIATAAQEPNQQQSFLAVISNAISNPNMSIEMLDKLLDVQERMMNKEAETAFNQAFSKMINEIPVIAKTSEAKVTTKAGGSFAIKYASLDEIVEVVRPILSHHGFSVSFTHEQFYNGNVPLIRVTVTLRHSKGHSITNHLDLPHDSSGAKNAIQEIGSTVSYGKRYTLCSILNIATGDDRDGYTAKAGEGVKKLPVFQDAWIQAAAADVKGGKETIASLASSYQMTQAQIEEIANAAN